MSEGRKMLVVAEEFNEIVNSYAAVQDVSNKGQLLSQALNGVSISMVNVLAQLRLVIKIEDGNS